MTFVSLCFRPGFGQQGADKLWPFATMGFMAAMSYGLMEYNVSAIGKQWTTAMIAACVLWGFGAPAIYVSGFVWGGGLEAIWSSIAVTYGIMVVIVTLMFVLFDWESYSEDVLERENAAMQEHEEDRIHSHTTGETLPILEM